MTDYRWAPIGPDDVTAWSELCNHLAVVDGTEEFYSPEDLAEELTQAHHDPSTDTWAVWDGPTMVGYAAAFVPANPDHEGRARSYISGGVHTDHRGRGLGSGLVERAEARCRELLDERHPGLEAYHSAGGGLEGSSARDLLADRGYAVVRYFNLLTRELGDEPEVPDLDGVELVCPGPEHEAATHAAHVVAFRDHWGAGPSSPESWHEQWVSRAARHDISTLAVARGDGGAGWTAGEVLAYVMVGQWVDREAYVSLVGTVPSARGRGLAAAALARTIGLATRSGEYDVIELDVDSDSPTGATRLYERVGFRHKHQTAAMRRPVERPDAGERPAAD